MFFGSILYLICLNWSNWKLVLVRINNILILTRYKLTILNVTLTKDVLFVQRQILCDLYMPPRNWTYFLSGIDRSILLLKGHFKSQTGKYFHRIYQGNVMISADVRILNEKNQRPIKSWNLAAFVNIEILKKVFKG